MSAPDLHSDGERYEFLRQSLRRNLSILERDFPTLFWVPNLAQERGLHPWDKPPYPFLQLCTYANGTGKTNLCVAGDMAATLLGPKYCNVEFVNGQYYRDIDGLRESGKLRTRITCDGEDIRENGSLWAEITDWIPGAKFSGKTSSGTFKQLQVPLPHNPSVVNYVDIKTFDQNPRSHAGANLHRIWINEPPPEAVFSETVGRTRSKRGQASTHILIFATVLDEAEYLFDYLEDPEFAKRVVHLEGSTWENCCGDEIPDEVAHRLHLEKDDDGNWITRGVLTRDSIENMISAWRKKPGEIEARLWGRPMHLGGAIWKTFDPMVHVVNDYPLPRRVPIFQVVDPHDAHADLSGWFYLTANGRVVWFMEWPEEPWELLHGRKYSISETCDIWRRMESDMGIASRIAGRFGDPNKFLDPDPNTMKTIQQLFAEPGNDFSFNTNINDSLEVGHRVVEEFFWYDSAIRARDPDDPAARPRQTFFASLRNLTTAAKRYGFRTNKDGSLTDRVSKKYKGGADIIRYGDMAVKTLGYGEYVGSQEQESDYDRVRKSRQGSRGMEKRSTIKGRRVVGSRPR